MNNKNSPNTPKKIIVSALILGFISFTLGFYFSEKNGLGLKELINTVSYNVRKFNFGPMLTEFKKVDRKESIDQNTVSTLIVKSTFSNIEIETVDSDKIDIEVSGAIRNEIEKETLVTRKEGKLLFIDVANKKISNPTASGLNAKIKISSKYRGMVKITTDSGKVTLNNMNESNILVWTNSGDTYFNGYRNNTLYVNSLTGSCYISSNNIKSDIHLDAGNIQVHSSTVKGVYNSNSGNISIVSEGIAGTTQINTNLGDVKFTAPLGYNYEIFSQKGTFKFQGLEKFRIMKGQFNNGVNLLRVSSTQGNISLE